MTRDSRQILTELLVLRAQGGDERSFARLHALWQADVARFAQASVQDSGAAAEVAQDVWVAVAKNLGRLEDPACFPRWLFQIGRRRVADCIRRRQRDRRVQSELESHQTTVAAGSITPADTPLRQIIEDLPGESRELLTLYYEVGRTVVEIAEIYRVPAGTIKSRLHTLRERLRTEIEKESS